jgi:hypothetical protein
MKKVSVVLLSAVCLTAATAGATQQAPVILGSASTFAVLAGTSVTVTSGGTIIGNVGVSPGTMFAPGLPGVTVNGGTYAGGAKRSPGSGRFKPGVQNDAAGRQSSVAVSGDLAGQTLTPGLYQSLSSLSISSGDLSLDAQGNPNAVFIIQIASSLTVAPCHRVILVGGANAVNIYWQVGGSATLGAALFQIP